MAFPVSPVNGQVYTTPSGLRYLFDSTLLTWVASSGSTINKDNMAGISAPTVNDDLSLGYGLGSTWIDNVNGNYYRCVDNSNGVAVWIKTGMTPAYFTSSLPLLTLVPAVTAMIPLVTTLSTNIINTAGSLSISVPGVYSLDAVFNYEATAKRKLYYPSVWVNGIADPIQGVTPSDRDQASIRWSRIYTIHKTLSLTAASTIHLQHFTDDPGSTVSGDIILRRID